MIWFIIVALCDFKITIKSQPSKIETHFSGGMSRLFDRTQHYVIKEWLIASNKSFRLQSSNSSVRVSHLPQFRIKKSNIFGVEK